MDPIDDLDLLGLHPGSPPEALKVAWRRAVAALHPDRDPTRDASRLAEVNAAYQRLEAYRQRHGRWPERRAVARPAETPHPRARPAARPRRRWTALALVLAGMAVALAWPRPEDVPLPVDLPKAERAAPAALLGTLPDRIRVGSTRDEVRRLAGRPTLEDGDVWIYGPSEIRFEDDRVVDWHDSSLRPLPVDAPRAGLR